MGLFALRVTGPITERRKHEVDEQNSEHRRRLSLVDPAGHWLQTFLQLNHCSSNSVFCLRSSKLYIPFLKNLCEMRLYKDATSLHSPLSMHACSVLLSILPVFVHYVCVSVFVYI